MNKWLAVCRDTLRMNKPARDELRCSFCGKHKDEVEKLIAGPRVFICNECVDLCNQIIAEERKLGKPSGDTK